MRQPAFLARCRAFPLLVLLLVPFRAPAGDPSLEASTAVASLVDRFDRAVADGLPARVAVPEAASQGRMRRELSGGIVVERRLPVDLRFPGDVAGVMYAGTLQDEPVVFTRAADQLSVSGIAEQAVRVTGFTSGRATSVRRSFPATGTQAADPVSVYPAHPSLRGDHFEDPLAFHPSFHIFLHDDLAGEDLYELHSRFVAWWLQDLLNILPGERFFSLYYYAKTPWISDIDYQRQDVLDGFANALSIHAASNPALPYGKTYKHKFLLLTAQPAIKGSSGLAFEGQSEATASITGRLSVVAHEFGHTMGATHAAADTLRMGPMLMHVLWWGHCDTNMHPVAPSSLSCLMYSEDNRRAIRAYQRHGPHAERGAPWLER